MSKKLIYLTTVLVLSLASEGWPKASYPAPHDGAIHEATWIILGWQPGENAVSFDIYVGTDYEDVKNGTGGTFQGNQGLHTSFFIVGVPGYPYPNGLVPGTTYYWRVDEINNQNGDNISVGDVWSFKITPRTAYNPEPADSAESVERNVILRWQPGFGSKLHTLYLGENFNDVYNASGGITLGMSSYNPGILELGKIYYWRVDESDGRDTYKGDVWSFTVGTEGPHPGGEEGIFYVDAVNGDDDNNGLIPQAAFATIQKGVDAAMDGDIVLVYPGIYQEEISFLGKALTVKGVVISPAGVPVLRNPGDFAASFYYGEGPDSILKNFIIRDSFMGIFIADSSPALSNLTIVGNKYGIEAYADSEPDISNTIVWDNTDGGLFGCQARYSFVQQVSEPLEGLIAYWKFDEDQGSIAYDSAGDNHGTIHGAQPTTGQVNGALSFDGEDDYVALPDNNPIWLPQFNFSCSAWVYFERESTTLLSEGEVILDLNHGDSSDTANELGYIIQRRGESRRLYFKMTTTTNSDEDLYSNEVLAANRWYHIVAVREGGTQAIYVNGLLDGSRTCSSDPIDFVGGYDDDRINIGRFTTNIGHPRFHHKGKIDDVMIFDRALSAEEIQQLYQGIYGFATNPLFADPANGDYHLRSERGRYWPEHDIWVLDKVTSPCVDGGDPDTGTLNEPMPNGGRINIGAYGGTTEASLSPQLLPYFIDQASEPSPADGAVNVDIDISLNWTGHLNAVFHDVYFGIDRDAVADSDTSDTTGIYRGRQSSTIYTPHEDIEWGRTYYWRIDEVDSGGGTITGEVWTFTTTIPTKGRVCFTAETNVWTNGALVPISTVALGKSICGINSLSKIQEVQEHNGTFTCYDVLLESGNCLSVAENHYFMTESGRWISLKNLKAGINLKTSKGTIEIKSVTKRPMPYTGKVYNLKVAGSDRYLVGKDAVIVRDY